MKYANTIRCERGVKCPFFKRLPQEQIIGRVTSLSLLGIPIHTVCATQKNGLCNLLIAFFINQSFCKMDESLKSLLSVETPDVGSHESDVKPVITIAGKYLFAILSVKAGDSREFGNGETKQFVPENYNDSTPEVLLVLKDVESEERWFEHFAIRAFRKFDGLTQAEVKALKPLNVRKDERDNYAIINDPVTKEPRRLVAQSGTAEHTGLMRIWSNLCGAAGLPLGTKFSEFEQLKGKSFWGTLQKREYMGRDRETGEMVKKTGLKLLPNFFPPSDSERNAIEELAMVTEEFTENV